MSRTHYLSWLSLSVTEYVTEIQKDLFKIKELTLNMVIGQRTKMLQNNEDWQKERKKILFGKLSNFSQQHKTGL